MCLYQSKYNNNFYELYDCKNNDKIKFRQIVKTFNRNKLSFNLYIKLAQHLNGP